MLWPDTLSTVTSKWQKPTRQTEKESERYRGGAQLPRVEIANTGI